MREERVVDTGLEYAPGDPVVIRVVRRDGRERASLALYQGLLGLESPASFRR